MSSQSLTCILLLHFYWAQQAFVGLAVLVPLSLARFRLSISDSASAVQRQEAIHCLASLAPMIFDPKELLQYSLARRRL